MKKTLILLFYLCFSSYLVNAQIAYYDAVALSRYVDTTGHFTSDAPSLAAICSILLKYYPDLGPDTDYHNVINAVALIPSHIDHNPILARYLSVSVPDEGENILAASSNSGGIGSTNVTNFADAIAKFLVERAREELYIAFFEKFKTFVNQKCPELKVLFPYTIKVVNNFNSIEFSNVIITLREAMDKDMNNMMANIGALNDYLQKDTSKNRIPEIEKLKVFFTKPDGQIFLSALAISNGFISGQKIPDILKVVSNSSLSAISTNSNFLSTIRLLNILSYSVRSTEHSKSYISMANFKNLWSGRGVAGNLYLGLLYAQIKRENIIINSVNVASRLSTYGPGLLTYMSDLLTQTDDLDTAINNLTSAKKKGEKDLSSYWAAIFQSANQFFITAENIQTLDASLSFPSDFQKVFTYSEQSLDIAHDISMKNYNAAIVGMLNLITTSMGAGDPDLRETIKGFTKYYSFVANVVAAKNSTDIQNAIEAIALPAGSYTVKRESKFNLTLQGYIGGFVGYEWLPALKTQQYSFTYGLSAPVGLAFSWGQKCMGDKMTKAGKSLTIFVPIIDVGALAAFRTQNDSSSYSSQVQLQNIIAPGLYFYWGFGNCPLSVGFGAQLGPQLRSINAMNKNVNNNFYIRYGLNIVMDIPIINLYTKKD